MGISYPIGFPSAIGDGDRWGETDHELQRILVQDGLTHEKEREVVLHEILHQILGLGNVGLSEDDEENVCTFLGAALVGHMRDNPTLWRYLHKKPPP